MCRPQPLFFCMSYCFLGAKKVSETVKHTEVNVWGIQQQECSQCSAEFSLFKQKQTGNHKIPPTMAAICPAKITKRECKNQIPRNPGVVIDAWGWWVGDIKFWASCLVLVYTDVETGETHGIYYLLLLLSLAHFAAGMLRGKSQKDKLRYFTLISSFIIRAGTFQISDFTLERMSQSCCILKIFNPVILVITQTF